MIEWNEDTERQWINEMVDKMQAEPTNVFQLALKLVLVMIIVFVLEGLILVGSFSLYHLVK